jgi:uncharacterized protein with PQ loop repeat
MSGTWTVLTLLPQCAQISADENASSFLAFCIWMIIILPAHWMLVGRLIKHAIRLAFG